MKNPFVKEDNTALIISIVAGSLAAAGITYLFLTDSGADVRKSIKKQLKEKAKDVASGVVSKKTGISKKLVKKTADAVVK